MAAVGKTLTIVDGGYPGTGLVIPHRRERSRANSRTGKRTTTSSTSRSGPESGTSSHG